MSESKLTRRSFFAGLGAVAAAGAAAKLLPESPPPAAGTDLASGTAEPAGDSYRLTEHIKKYYRTTTI